MRKLFTLLFALMASVGTMFASDTQVNGIWYNFDSSTHTATVTYQGDSYDSYANEYSGSVTIPSSVTYNEMTYSVTTIGENAFQYCTELTSVTIPNSVTYIAWAAFSACTGLTSVEIPNGVIWIEHYAFSDCTGLTSVTIPNSVKSVGHGAFRNCFSLTSVTIPSSVTDIKSEAFANCTSLSDINIESGNLNYCSVDGIVFNKEKTSIICYPAGKTNTEYNIPNNITSIEDDAFVGCRSLTSVNIPNSVTSIGSGAFQFCTSLTSVEIPNSVTYLGGYSFYGCKGLTSVAIPNSIISIGNYTFYGCVGLNSIIIPSDVTSIGKGALSSCTTLTSITNYAVTPQTINANVFNNITISELTLYVPEESVEAYKAADVWKDFGNILPIEETPEPCIVASGTCGAQVDNLTWTLTCDSVLTISGTGEMGDFADTYYVPWYNERFSIKTIIVEQGVTSIGKWSFGNCVNVTSVTLPSSITNIGNWAFGGCQMESLIIPNSVSSIGNYAFYTCGALKNLTLPSNLISIGNYAFCACENLGLIEIPDKVASIGEGAFRYCSGLTSVTIPNNVTSIGNGAFDGCSNLTTITNYATIPQPLDPDGISVFGGVPLACTLYVPAESIALYQTADVWKDFGNILAIEESGEAEVLSIAEAIQIGMALDSMATSAETYTIEGYVINAGTFYAGAKYQNWYMADDQETASSDFQAYKCYPIDGIDTVEVRNGSKVRMTGHLQKYYDRQKALYVVEMTYTPAIILSKPQIDTITVAEALALGTELEDNASTDKQYTIRGYVSSFSPYYEQYGYQNFYIADDSNSTANTNAAGGFYVFRGIPSTGTAVNKGDLVELTCAIRKYVPASGTNINIENSEFPVSVTVLQAASDTCIVASGTCGAEGDNLTWTLSCDSVLTISGTGRMANYVLTNSKSPAPWYTYRTAIKSVVIEDGVTSIGKNAFSECDMALVMMSGSVSAIADYAFSSCKKIISVDVAIDNQNYCSVDGILFNKNKTTLILYPAAKSDTSYSIPESVTRIGTASFEYCDSLSNIHIPNSVISIGRSAFYGSSTLTYIAIPNSVTSIEEGAFIDCRGLTSVTIGNSVTSIVSSAFYNCSSLTTITNYAVTPQTISSYVFTNVNISSCTLYVPAQSVAAYQAADVWKDFYNILPIGGQPIEPTEGEFNVLYVGQEGDSISSEEVTLHLPVAPVIEGFLFVGWQTVSAMLTEGIIIQAVYQAEEPTSAPAVYTNPANPAQKLIRNGNVYILRDDKVYTVTGQTVK